MESGLCKNPNTTVMSSFLIINPKWGFAHTHNNLVRGENEERSSYYRSMPNLHIIS